MAPDSAREPVAPPERLRGVLGTSRDGGTSAPAPAAASAKRRPGRPRGQPKSGGRMKGTPNKSTAQTRDRIQELADPIQFLADVMNGVRMTAAGEPGDKSRTWVYPTLAQRVQAGETLLRKLLPDLKSQELTGAGGTPLVEPTHRDELISKVELARRLAFVLAAADDAKRELATLGAPRIDTEPHLSPETEHESATKKPAPTVVPTEPPLAPAAAQ